MLCYIVQSYYLRFFINSIVFRFHHAEDEHYNYWFIREKEGKEERMKELRKTYDIFENLPSF